VRGGLATSVVLHAAILGWALITIPSQRELRVAEPEPIAVDIVSASELTKLRQGVRTAKQLEAEAKATKAEPAKKEAPKPTPAAAAPPPPPPPEPDPPAPKEEPKQVAAVPPPPPAAAPPVPSPEDQKKFEEMLKEQQRQAEEQKKAEEQRQAELKKKQEEAKKRAAELKKKRKEAEAKKKQFDAEKIAALLNKTPDKGSPAAPSAPHEPTKAKGPVLGAPEGRDRQLSASELAVLKQIIRSCVGPKWNVFGGGEEAQNTIVKIRVLFHPDGRLAATPQIVNPQNSPFFLAAAESALRAVQACEPYPLPPDKYNVWKDTVLTLNPRDMF